MENDKTYSRVIIPAFMGEIYALEVAGDRKNEEFAKDFVSVAYRR